MNWPSYALDAEIAYRQHAVMHSARRRDCSRPSGRPRPPWFHLLLWFHLLMDRFSRLDHVHAAR
ncbi:MAG TPA: hypothetical protein VFQ15_00240 [Jiangellaceae bacterium]|nr:hypothetical protein [Jiangellaceae bacterium]